MPKAAEKSCAACGAPIPPSRARSAAPYCDGCARAVRAGTLHVRCKECGVAKAAPRNYKPSGQSLTGYISTCLPCERPARDPTTELTCRLCKETRLAEGNFRRTTARFGYLPECKDCLALPPEVLPQVRERRESGPISALPPEQRQAEIAWLEGVREEGRDRAAARERQARQDRARRQREDNERAAHRAAARAARASVLLTCAECGQEKPARGNFRTSAQSRTGYVRVCHQCKALRAARAREEVKERECCACQQLLPAAANFKQDDSSKTGYHHVCNACRALRDACPALPDTEHQRLLRERHGAVAEESRRLWERHRREIAREVLGGYHWGGIRVSSGPEGLRAGRPEERGRVLRGP